MKPLAIGAAVGLGLVLGSVSAIYLLRSAAFGSENYGGWAGSTLTGAKAADLYTRAIVARSGLLALNRSETVYFTLSKDEHGQPLSQNCAYQLKGAGFPARWWSVTIYAADNYLPKNHDHAFSINDSGVQKDPGGGWTAAVALQRPGPGGAPNWISTWAAGRFTLTLRLYNPSSEAVADPHLIIFPQITKLSCSGAKA